MEPEYWSDIEDELQELKNVLKSYNPLDYDELNEDYIYDIENGKRLIADYDKIVSDFWNKVDKKIKDVKLERKREQLELLKSELKSYEKED